MQQTKSDAAFTTWEREATPIRVIWTGGQGESIQLMSTNSAGFWFVDRDGADGFAPWSAIFSMRAHS
jgi:hypothetical protein